MHTFTILISFGILYQELTEGLQFQPYKSCNCDGKHNHDRKKRQIASNSEPNHLPPFPNQPGAPTFHNNQKILPPNQWNHAEHAKHEGKDKESEIVGLAGLLHLHALATRAKARATVARARARARLHRPLLLEPTPEEFLHDDDSQNNFPGPILSLNQQNNPVNQQNFNQLQETLPASIIPRQLPTQPRLETIETKNPPLFPNSARSAENYEYNQYQPPPPEIRVHNIDNSEEVYQNRQPGFSIIPTNWKPPPDSNLYVQGDYEEKDGQEPILAVLPGKWTDDDGYDTYYYDDYDVIPIAYNIPERGAPNYYERSADPEEGEKNEFPESFLGLKNQLENWEDNPMIWRPDSNNNQRSADPSEKRHFHHSHVFTHKHVWPGHSSGFHQSSSFVKPTVPIQHGFSHDDSQFQNSGIFDHQIPDQNPIQHSSFANFQSQGHKSGFSHQLSHGHSITINNQKTMVVVPSGTHKNVEIAQVTGTNNAVSQSQASSQAHQGFGTPGGFLPENSHFQAAQVSGSGNSVSQSQSGGEAPFVGENFLGAPYLINVPRRSQNFWRTHNDFPQKSIRKRSIDDKALANDFTSPKSKKIFDVLGKQNQLLKQIQETAKDDKELLFITEMGSNLIDNFEESLKAHSLTKRTVPILRLIADPNAKLDVPKTLENMGTVARNSFENKRAPMYHLKNFAGSAKDAFLSTLRIVPQDFLVPSRYKIIDRERESIEPSKTPEEVRAISPSLLPRSRTLRERIKERRNPQKEIPVRQPETPREPEDNFSETYRKIGSMFRESVQSGQDTLNHMGELYHSTRKALATARYSAPRVLLSSMRIPAVQHHQPFLPHNDKVLMIAPKILQLKQESVGAPHYSEKMDEVVGIGNVMDSLGISNPDAKEVGRRRIIFQPVTAPKPIIPNLQSRSNFDDNQPSKRYFVLADALQSEASEEGLQDTMDALDNAREAVGANSLKDFVLQMKNGLSNLFKDKLEEARDKLSERLNSQRVKGKVLIEPEGKHPISFKFKATNPLKLAEDQPIAENQNETVGAGLFLPKQLLTPFMGQPSRSERREYFEELGDSEELSKEKEDQEQDGIDQNDQEVIGGINPIIFNKTFDLCDNRNPFEFLAAWNSSKYANHTKGEFNKTEDDGSELWEHKCVYMRNITAKPSDIESTTKINIETRTETTEESTTKVNIMVTSKTPEELPSITDGVQSTTKINMEKHLDEPTQTTVKTEQKKNPTMNQKNPTDDVGISMKMGKHLLTPFMGKPYEKEIYQYFEPYGDSYEEDSDEDGYLGIGNPEQLQALPNQGTMKNNKGPVRTVTAKKQNKLADPLDLNHL